MPSIDRVRFASQNISIIVSVLLLLFLSTHSSGQTTQTTTDKMTPSGMTPGAPAGSYPLSGMESINLFNGNLDFRLPLLSLDGRGSAVRNMMLSLNTKKWRVRESHTQTNDTFTPTTVNWGSVNVGYAAGKLQGRQSGWSSRTCTNPPQTRYYYTNTKLTFVTPDGTEYDLRDQLTDGQPKIANQCGGTQGASRGTIFKTSDGSGVIFISDNTIFDKTTIPTGTVGSWNLIVSGYLLLRDGTRYRIDSGSVSWIRDRNGNLVYSQTDAINRQITMTTLPDGSDQITYRGYQGTVRTITITNTLLQNALRAGYSLQTHPQLFPELNGAANLGTYNPSVISSVILPDGRSYQFRYNSYGELARVVLPTGGAIEYDMTAGSGVIEGSGSYGVEYQIYRRVIERRTYVDGTTLEGRTTYTSDGSTTSVSNYNSAGTLLSRESHSYSGNGGSSLFAPVEGAFYSDWREGLENSTSYYAADGVTVLKTVTNTWAQRAPVSWYPTQWSNGGNEPANDPRITETVTTLVDTNQVSKTTYSYDQYNNEIDSYEYDYGTGAAGALVRHTHTDYVTTNPVNGTDYTATSVYLRSLPSQTSVFDAGGVERLRTTLEYDNYAADGNHWPLTDRANISGHDSGFTTGYATRGNLTAITRYLLTNGTVTGSVTAYSQFDIAGNLTKAIDGRGYATNIDYDDRFGGPDGEARSNTAPSELAGLSSFAFATKFTNALGQTIYGQYDYYLGRSVDGEDYNGIVSSGYYNDVLDRPTQVRRAVATAAASQSTFSYDDPNRTISVTSDLNANNDNALLIKTIYDGLGRTIETRQYEGGTNYIAVQTQYDGLGRAYKTSNPFRPWQSEGAQWTTRGFDGMSRASSVTTPDNAVVATSYIGNTVTVTDQAGKSRKSVTDALGRLISVYEDPAGLNYQTSYAYDVLDNLTTVTQGTQTRTFVYDSLKRLKSAINPESGTVAYNYDNNSNLTQKTDGRGVVSTYAYDALNRNTTIDYSDTSSINPDVTRYYDGAINGKGRFWYNYAGGDFSNGSNVEHTAIDSYDALGRPTVQRQLFKVNGTWGTTYQTSRAYNLGGSVTSQTYPSGHTVSYSYDSAGRTSSLSGNLGDGASRTYTNNITYSSFGSVSREQFGSNTPLYHKRFYNIRGQLFDIRLSSVNDTWDWNRGRLILYYSSNHVWGESGTDNNGNVLNAENWIPPENATLDQPDTLTEDVYSYDALNRLSSVSEQRTSVAGGWGTWTQQFRQQYAYDRYGNRTIDAAQTWGTGVNNKQFTVDAATNRLGVPAGQSGVMTYDNAGNLISDTYTGVGTRTYDAENRMITAADNTGQTSRYSYNADGLRVRRQIASSQEEWQIYGLDGELLAEYKASSPATAPEKEYGYRDRQLVVTATGRLNVALAANGGVATASSAYACCGFSTTGAINGNNSGPWGNGEGWNDATPDQLPDWFQVDFAGSRSIDEIDVFSLHDKYTQANTPTETQTFSLYGLINFEVQYWNGSSWVTIPGGSVSGNNKVWRKFTFAPITTSKIRLWITSVPDSWSRLVELQAWGTGGDSTVQWLVPDHLGTPRMIVEQTGSLANVRRHDYLPFGEELFAGAGGRSATQGYASGDGVRQQFTQEERDIETGLDYFLTRYYASTQGRFTSPDEFTGGPRDVSILGSGHPEKQALKYADITDPQSLNKYQYALNNPLRYIDPDGQTPQDGLEIRLRADEKAFAEGKISEKEFRDRCVARGVGAVVGLAILATAYIGWEAAATVLVWASQHPDHVEQIAMDLTMASTGSPAPGNPGTLTLSGVTRLSIEEANTGARLAAQLGEHLSESSHIGEEFISDLGKTFDAMGTPDAYLHWGSGKAFFKSILHHVNKSVDYVAIDLTGATQSQIDAIYKYVSTLTKEQQAKIIYVR